MSQTSDNKCFLCKGKCCSYTTEALGTMRSKSDFEHLLWQVAHEGVEAYKDDSGWYLLYTGTCQFLQPDGLCGIYETRPQICRDYENDWCEYDEPASKHFIYHFRDYNELLDYCRKRFKRWDK
ncbi:YkgJ family cysteine cluster protein [Solemya velum gill symbiont]|uniref:YkgJ family cysteine cluster protein n=1 Tax=Solemya velum gill symbiont TaxID=2340 RepID=UPI0009968ABF|nr:YkgJ family cysteine cluster protein [Solemya velum gill symbiont]OOY99770.1 zinc/iron-chelating domain-containing protein [Solemya velum gill symbiont]OOZ01957.1 zinc/iron-chelating domain-containing protein [Solemya velum gill symbiont]OOZ04319.1 zinc/iron-chelating domain-containing protein [Solemya velum gill symbiont]OOZ06537.1 zinc/iron-chelating domain-containing protein [Solemya velum gill symbiont]OOZ08723.1 zinc/iron-chelating domain-containing protein [Solemya velum gill symbiont